MSTVAYWDRGIELVSIVTGAASVMDCSDIRDALRGAGVGVPMGRVLDVGCGTGRISILCDSYFGVDISHDAVAYCTHAGLDAASINGPYDLGTLQHTFDTVCCLSVFTHISRAERQTYLWAFHRLAAQLVVDIIPGVEGGSVVLWRADPDGFEEDLAAAGFNIHHTYDRTSPDGVTHRYFNCEPYV